MSEDALQRQLRFSAALNQLAEVALGSDQPQRIMHAMTDIAGLALRADRALVYDVRLAEQQAVALSEYLNPEQPGITPTLATYPLEPFGDALGVLLQARTFLESHRSAPNPHLGPAALGLLHGEAQMNIGSLLWLPFHFRESGFHLLAFNQLAPRAWQADELDFVGAVGRQVRLALVKFTLMADRERALEALEVSEAQYRALYDDTPSMFFTVSEEGKVTSVNRFALAELGYAADELVGRDVRELFVPEDRAGIARQLVTCFEHPGQVFRWEARKSCKDGAVISVREIARTGRGPKGRKEMLIVCEDVTEQKRTEQAMLQTQKLESLGVLVGSIAHDFNNLLGAVVGNAELALIRLPRDSAARELVEQAALAGQRSAELVKQLLAYSAKAAFTRQRVDVNELVRELAEFLEVTVGKRARVSLQLEPGALWVVTDPTQLRQVIMNLVHNAADAMAGREGTVSVSTRVTALGERSPEALAPGRYVRIDVTDTGVGIDAATLARIFDPFFTTKVSGRGLGLSAVRSIAHRHGGGVVVNSQPGVGSIFSVLLPVAPAEVAPVSAEEARPAPPLPRGATVLVVDDDEGLRQVLSQVLRELGLVPLLAAKTSAALELFHDHPEISCALVDLTVPGGGGPLLLRELHTFRPDLPVLMMSGFDEGDDTAAVKGELAGFLAKPFSPLVLQDALCRALSPSPRGGEGRGEG